MAPTALRKLYGWEETKTRQKDESREQQLERILRYRREHCPPLIDSVDEIMLALAEKYAVEKNERWSLVREGSAIGKAVIFWLNNRKELRSFLHDPRICPDNNQIERSVRTVAVYAMPPSSNEHRGHQGLLQSADSERNGQAQRHQGRA